MSKPKQNKALRLEPMPVNKYTISFKFKVSLQPQIDMTPDIYQNLLKWYIENIYKWWKDYSLTIKNETFQMMSTIQTGWAETSKTTINNIIKRHEKSMITNKDDPPFQVNGKTYKIKASRVPESTSCVHTKEKLKLLPRSQITKISFEPSLFDNDNNEILFVNMKEASKKRLLEWYKKQIWIYIDDIKDCDVIKVDIENDKIVVYLTNIKDKEWFLPENFADPDDDGNYPFKYGKHTYLVAGDNIITEDL